MRLTTSYAPPTFLKPCLIVDTCFTEGGEKETAVLFNQALNANHALGYATDEVRKVEEITGSKKVSEWAIVQKHTDKDQAVAYHLKLTEHLHNGGTDEEWNEGYDDYLKLYNKYCPDEMKDKYEAGGEA